MSFSTVRIKLPLRLRLSYQETYNGDHFRSSLPSTLKEEIVSLGNETNSLAPCDVGIVWICQLRRDKAFIRILKVHKCMNALQDVIR